MKNESISNPEIPGIADFMINRKIDPADMALIQDIASFSRDLIITSLHNIFNVYRNKSDSELEYLISTSRDENTILLYRKMLEFSIKYGWATSLNLVRVLEGEV
jgi:hypothetical protein